MTTDLAALTAELRGYEERILDPAVRADPAQIRALLAPEFGEFGASGRVFDRGDIEGGGRERDGAGQGAERGWVGHLFDGRMPESARAFAGLTCTPMPAPALGLCARVRVVCERGL